MDLMSQWKQLMIRRQFFGKTTWGIGGCALGSLLNRTAFSSTGESSSADETILAPHFPAKAKRIIYIFRCGGPAQMETFDYKPGLEKLHGQPLPDSVLGNQRLTGFSSSEKVLSIAASPYPFSQHGQSGNWICDLMPYQSQVIDDMCIIRSMTTESVNHDPALTYMMTGFQLQGRPSLGAWASYGLGSENENLPAFVVLLQSSVITDASTAVSASHWGSGFLPSQHQGVKFRSSSDPVLFLSNPPGIDAGSRRQMLDVGAQLNRLQHEAFGDPEINTRIEQYEMAYRMQSSVPELTDLSKESEETFKLYGEGSKVPGSYAANCILARRLSEAGVRYVQIFDRDWDHHRNLKSHMPRKSKETDQPTAALLQDLKQRGMLEETLVVCSGEFGRSVYCQGKFQNNFGRDHHGRCFSSWMAGAGVNRGAVIGQTDDFSFNVAEEPVHVHDFNATILHLMGVDHTRLTYRHQGRDFRLTDVHGNVVQKALT